MHTEYEIKVLDIDTTRLTTILLALGFQKQTEQAFQRYVYELGKDGAWIRLRTDGVKTTLTYKHAVSDAIDGVKELEVMVDDFAKTHEFLEIIGHKASTYQENRRTNFILDDVEISIDEWPHIPPYAEIEAKDKETVERYVRELHFESHKTTSKPTSYVYELYGLKLDSYDQLSFTE